MMKDRIISNRKKYRQALKNEEQALSKLQAAREKCHRATEEMNCANDLIYDELTRTAHAIVFDTRLTDLLKTREETRKAMDEIKNIEYDIQNDTFMNSKRSLLSKPLVKTGNLAKSEQANDALATLVMQLEDAHKKAENIISTNMRSIFDMQNEIWHELYHAYRQLHKAVEEHHRTMLEVERTWFEMTALTSI